MSSSTQAQQHLPQSRGGMDEAPVDEAEAAAELQRAVQARAQQRAPRGKAACSAWAMAAKIRLATPKRVAAPQKGKSSQDSHDV